MYEELVKKLRSHNGWALNETLDEAADAIEKLLAYESLYKDLCDKGQKTAEKLLDARPKWISVGERLPEMRKPVLCLLRSICYGGKSYYYAVDYMLDDNQWWESGGSWKYEVTHWMPLPPPPPKEDEP